jgi:ankyrin repeat protein
VLFRSEEVVQLLLDHNASVDLANNDGCGPLALASVEGLIQTVKVLLDAGAYIDSLDNEGLSPLMNAAAEGNIEVVDELLHRGANVNLASETTGLTALMEASMTDQIEVVQLLCDHGADIEQRDNQGFTPIMCASAKGNLDAVVKLVALGASVEVVVEVPDPDAQAPPEPDPNAPEDAPPFLAPRIQHDLFSIFGRDPSFDTPIEEHVRLEGIESIRSAITEYRAAKAAEAIKKRRDENWERRRNFALALVVSRFLPSRARLLELQRDALGHEASIPPLPIETLEDKRRYNLGLVFSNELLAQRVASFL